MSKRWVVAAKKADFNAIGSKYHISPYLARIIRNRDIITDEAINMFLNGRPENMHDPALLKDIYEASEIIKEAFEAGVKIRIIGDYDIDGVCASYILKSGLAFMGADVDVRLPDRIKDGYGINEAIIKEASDEGVELIITCDNGIAASDEIEFALSLGISVVVTDHHEVPFEEINGQKVYKLPKADAVVDPKREDDEYPFSGICGAMVAYKLIQFMLKDYSVGGQDELLEELFSMAAFATIGDVMELTNENRIAVKYGLDILRRTTNVGMKALMAVTGISKETLSAFHIGFVLGPCVNASGRLDTAKRALELFESVDMKEATIIATELKDLNESRKNMTVSFANEAIKMVEEEFSNDKVIVVFLPSCHESIAGIVAGRIRERFYRPSIVLTLDDNGDVKGSGRSIENYDMFAELTKVKDIFTKFGGHKMAAGMSLKRDDISRLRKRLNDNCSLTDEDIIEKLTIDIPLPISYVTLDFIDELEKLAPFGVSNPKPLFAQKDVPIMACELLGKNSNVLKLRLQSITPDGKMVPCEAILFENAQEAYAELSNKDKVSILYQAGVNEYMGRRNVQLIIKDYMA